MGSLSTLTPILPQQAGRKEPNGLQRSMPGSQSSLGTVHESIELVSIDDEVAVPADLFDSMLKRGQEAKNRFAHDKVQGRYGVTLVRKLNQTPSSVTKELPQSTVEQRPTCPPTPCKVPQSLEGGPEAFLRTPLSMIQWEDQPFQVLFDAMSSITDERWSMTGDQACGEEENESERARPHSVKEAGNEAPFHMPVNLNFFEEQPFRVLLDDSASHCPEARREIPGKFLKPRRKQKSRREHAVWSLMLENW